MIILRGLLTNLSEHDFAFLFVHVTLNSVPVKKNERGADDDVTEEQQMDKALISNRTIFITHLIDETMKI